MRLLKTLFIIGFIAAMAVSAPVSFEQATIVAENATKSKKINLKYKRFKQNTTPKIIGQMLAPAVSAPPLLYIFQNGENNGFVIISGDDVFKPIIGISQNGTFDENDLPPNFAWYLNNIESEMAFALENGQAQSFETANQWRSFASGALYVEGTYLIKTKWSQGSPYNDLTPRIDGVPTYTGCLATAMAQIIKYHEFPKSKTTTISGYKSNAGLSIPSLPPVEFDWANMTNTYNDYPPSDVANNAVATLMLYCGVSINMNYRTDGSDALTGPVSAALMARFDYDQNAKYISHRGYYESTSTITWEDMLKDQVNQNLPVFYTGDGHAFVLDGYDSDNNFHFNWGWGGNYDGFYALTIGSGINPGRYIFSSEYNQVVINIKPNPCTLGHSGSVGHIWGGFVVKTEPTCIKPGMNERECTYCGVRDTTYVTNVNAHNWGDWEVTKRPICEIGEKFRICLHNEEHKDEQKISIDVGLCNEITKIKEFLLGETSEAKVLKPFFEKMFSDKLAGKTLKSDGVDYVLILLLTDILDNIKGNIVRNADDAILLMSKVYELYETIIKLPAYDLEKIFISLGFPKISSTTALENSNGYNILRDLLFKYDYTKLSPDDVMNNLKDMFEILKEIQGAGFTIKPNSFEPTLLYYDNGTYKVNIAMTVAGITIDGVIVPYNSKGEYILNQNSEIVIIIDEEPKSLTNIQLFAEIYKLASEIKAQYAKTTLDDDLNLVVNGLTILTINNNVIRTSTEILAELAERIWTGSVNTSWYNAIDKEFTITTAEQLAGLASLVNSGNNFLNKTIKLGADIMFNDTNSAGGWQNWGGGAIIELNQWTAIGNDRLLLFRGTFDGCGFIMSGIYINNSDSNYQGLFGYTSGTIKNLGVVASNIKTTAEGAGSLVGYNTGTIINCYSIGNVFSQKVSGGIVGYNINNITSSYAIGNISSSGGISGGFVGTNAGKITNCYYDSQISGLNDTNKGTPKTTEEMKRQITFNNWDFDEIWGLSSSVNNGYPHLHRISKKWVTVTSATCAKKEFQKRICTIKGCNHEITQEIGGLLEHSYTVQGTEVISATCTEKAVYKKKCESCPSEHPDETMEGDLPLGHDFEITTPATCKASGLKTCTRDNAHTEEIPQLTGEECEDVVSIFDNPTKNEKYGIKLTQNPVSAKAEISIILSNNEKISEAKIIIYDMTGNIVFVGAIAPNRPLIWDLRNKNGKLVANGTYLVIAEVIDTKGITYHYSAKLGVKR